MEETKIENGLNNLFLGLIGLFFLTGILCFGSILMENTVQVDYSIKGDVEPPDFLKEGEYIGYCDDDVLESGVELYVSKNLGENVGGQFYSWKGRSVIALVSTTTNTIAHEVSHLVDKIIEGKRIHDG